jgi:predicted amidophosphoribosyltransferase
LDVIRVLKKNDITSNDHICESCLNHIDKTSDNYCRMCGSIIYKL